MFVTKRIFLKHPEIKYIWKFAAHLETPEEMLKNPQLKSHGNNVFEAVNAAVNSLDKTESLNKLLIELGARHIRYGAKIYYFPVNKAFKFDFDLFYLNYYS